MVVCLKDRMLAVIRATIAAKTATQNNAGETPSAMSGRAFILRRAAAKSCSSVWVKGGYGNCSVTTPPLYS